MNVSCRTSIELLKYEMMNIYIVTLICVMRKEKKTLENKAKTLDAIIFQKVPFSGYYHQQHSFTLRKYQKKRKWKGWRKKAKRLHIEHCSFKLLKSDCADVL